MILVVDCTGGVRTFSASRECKPKTALARLRERGDHEVVGEGFGICSAKKVPLTPGCAVPSPFGEGRDQLRPNCASKCANSRGGVETAPFPLHGGQSRSVLSRKPVLPREAKNLALGSMGFSVVEDCKMEGRRFL